MARACKSAEATLLKGRTQPYTTTQQPASSQKGRPKRATSAHTTAPSLVLAASTVNLRRMARGWLGLGLGLGLGSGLGLVCRVSGPAPDGARVVRVERAEHESAPAQDQA